MRSERELLNSSCLDSILSSMIKLSPCKRLVPSRMSPTVLKSPQNFSMPEALSAYFQAPTG